jgi:hypothetical protein
LKNNKITFNLAIFKDGKQKYHLLLNCSKKAINHFLASTFINTVGSFGLWQGWPTFFTSGPKSGLKKFKGPNF